VEATALRAARDGDAVPQAEVEGGVLGALAVVVALRSRLPIHNDSSGREAGNALCLGVPHGSQVVVERRSKSYSKSSSK